MPIRSATASNPIKRNTASSKAQAVSINNLKANDPAQHATVSGNVIRIAGVARNNGFVQSSIAFSVGGNEVRLPLTGGITPTVAATMLKAKLPKEYVGTVDVLTPARQPGGPIVEYGRGVPATLTITRKAAR